MMNNFSSKFRNYSYCGTFKDQTRNKDKPYHILFTDSQALSSTAAGSKIELSKSTLAEFIFLADWLYQLIQNQTMKVYLLIVALLCLASCQVRTVQATVTLSPLLVSQTSDQSSDYQKTLNNYFGCKTWKDDVCVECSARYYFNKNGICCEVKPECREFNTQEGICQGCYAGYRLVDGECVASNAVDPRDQGCKTWQNERCVECAKRWYQSSSGVCVAVNDFCRTWAANGVCDNCYTGYRLANGNCLLDTTVNVSSTDPLCASWTGNVCNRCAERAYRGSAGICVAVNQNCNTWDRLTGACLSCYKGFTFRNGVCTKQDQQGPSDPGCKTWDWDRQICQECAPRYISRNGACIQVDPSCSSWTANGVCTACYKGFTLNNGACVKNEQQGPSDPGCKTWDWDRQVCQECAPRYISRSGVCVQIDPSCSSWGSNGVCTACYKGFTLNNGVCTKSDQQGPKDPGCKTWDWDRQICQECAPRYISRNGVCVQVDPSCSVWNSAGVCTSCYKGFTLTNSVCVKNDQQGPKDPGCKTWDWDRQVCQECASRYIARNGVCVQIDPSCSSWGANGICTACYGGYTLNNGACVLSQEQGPKDDGCKSWDWNRQTCLECSGRYILRNGRCASVDASCATWNQLGQCTSCYKGFVLNNGACVQSTQSGAKDPGCKSWDWDRLTCLECSARYILRNGACTAVDNNCQTWSSTGICATCYKGYTPSNGACVLSNQGPTDDGCKTWNWDRQTCLECSNRWILRNGRCAPVDNNCATWNSNGVCTTCYKGFALNNGACVRSDQQGPKDQGCKSWDWERQTCSQCSTRYFFRNGRCTAVDSSCATWNDAGTCTSCYTGYQVSNGVCQLSQAQITCKQVNKSTGVCIKCYAGYVLFRNNCVLLSSVANLAAYYAECCPEKLATLKAEQRMP